MVCVRFLEEFVEWRLISKSQPSAGAKANRASENRGDLAGDNTSKSRSFLDRIVSKKVASANALRNGFPRPTTAHASTPPKEHFLRRSASFGADGPTNQPKDVPAAHIFLTPTIRPIDQRRSRPLINLFTSFVSELGAAVLPMYTTLEEVCGQVGVELFFSSGTSKITYWWIWESASWKIVFDPTDKTAIEKVRKEPKTDETNVTGEVSRSGRPLARNDSVGEASERSLNPQSSGSSVRSRFRRSNSDAKQPKSSPLATCGTVKVDKSPSLSCVGG